MRLAPIYALIIDHHREREHFTCRSAPKRDDLQNFLDFDDACDDWPPPRFPPMLRRKTES